MPDSAPPNGGPPEAFNRGHALVDSTSKGRFSAGNRRPLDRRTDRRLHFAQTSPAVSVRHRADRALLIRRLTLDTIGLPPTPEEVEHFVHDTDPEAYSRLVNSLLDSPRYGERWARHWLERHPFCGHRRL